MPSVTLIQEESPEISINLTAEVNSKGEFVMSGQDLGPRVEELTGDSDYEYWTTVASDQTQKVLVQLLLDAFDNLLDLHSWLKSAHFEFRSAVTVVYKESFSVEISERHISIRKESNTAAANSTEGVFFIDRSYEGHLLIDLLEEMFKREFFKNDSDVHKWLKKTRH